MALQTAIAGDCLVQATCLSGAFSHATNISRQRSTATPLIFSKHARLTFKPTAFTQSRSCDRVQTHKYFSPKYWPREEPPEPATAPLLPETAAHDGDDEGMLDAEMGGVRPSSPCRPVDCCHLSQGNLCSCAPLARCTTCGRQ